MKKLVIAEKPSVAGDIARVLGKAKKIDDYYENDEYVISSALGHLIELPMPADVDKKYARWTLSNLPILPEKFVLKPIEKSKKKFQTLKKLLGRDDISEVINACDAGREGELIFTYIYEVAKSKLPRRRLWMSSMTPDSIREAFANLKPQEEMESLQDAARCRSESDWIVGMNGTRAVTARMYGTRGKALASVGRVQTPTLAMIVEREREIQNFTPKNYWKLFADFGIANGDYRGTYQRPDFKKADAHDQIDRIWDEESAKKILEDVKRIGFAEVSEKKTQSKQTAPKLYDLTSLQREANNRFSYSAARTLSIAQALYEKHKMITYPRTDSRALPEDYRGVVSKTLSDMSGRYATFAQKAIQEDYVSKATKKIFNNKQVSDHFAVIPTGQNSDKLSEDEAKIYDMIARRFIAAFYPDALHDVTTRISKVGEHNFKTEGKILKFPGWLAVYEKSEAVAEKKDDEEESVQTLPALNDGEDKAAVNGAELKPEATKPPARFTEATLLSAMEGAGKLIDDEELAEAMKERGLGTPATRAQIIDTLVAHKYVERQRRELVPTVKAESLVTFLNAVGIQDLTSPAMTGEWEHKLRQIEKKELTRKEFMAGISSMATNIVESAKAFNESDASTKETNIVSPSDGEKMLESFRSFRSKDGKIVIYKTMGNRKMSEEEVSELLANKIIGPLDGFKSKMGKPYSAFLKLDEEFKVKFQFGTANGENGEGSSGVSEEDLANAKVVADCPKSKHGPCNCGGGKLLETSSFYICSNSANKEKPCTFKIWRNMLSHAIKPEEVASLAENGRTPLIDDFVSKRTGKKFSAYLVLKDNGDIGFEFEKKAPRAPKASPAKKASEVSEE